MAKYYVTATIRGTASAEIEADSTEEAIALSLNEADWKISDWDLDTSEHRGGWIDAEQET